jgi:hypothetical protein
MINLLLLFKSNKVILEILKINKINYWILLIIRHYKNRNIKLNYVRIIHKLNIAVMVKNVNLLMEIKNYIIIYLMDLFKEIKCL